MPNDFFRKEALDQLTGPKQLDRLMTVTSLRSWLILLAIAILLLSTIIWSVTGTIYTRVNTSGVLVNSGGVVTISSAAVGQVSDIRAVAGQNVKKGDIIARLDQPELITKINRLAAGNNWQSGTEQLDALRKELRDKSYIISHYDGRVAEVYIKAGEYVQAGTPIIMMAKGGDSVQNIIAVMYVPIEEGRRLTAGMETNLYPSFASKEAYGFMMGRVVRISEYPVTEQSIYSRVGSREIAKELASSGAVLEVIIDLVHSADTVSGFKWSTSDGPPLKLENGTICQGAIITGKMRPIEMVVPSLNMLD